MKKTGFYKKDWFVALLAGLLFMLLVIAGNPTLENLEHYAYDAGVRMTHRSASATENVTIVAIDDASLKAIGRWPWPRSILADMVEQLAQAEAKAVGLLIFLNEPQLDPGLTHIRKLKSHVENTTFPRTAQGLARELSQLIGEAENDLDTDNRLASVLPSAGNVYMPMFFQPGRPLGKPEAALPEFVSRNRLTRIVSTAGGSAAGALSTIAADYPLERFAQNVRGIGHLTLITLDGGRAGVRTANLVAEHYGEYYPSLPLLLAARHLNLGPEDIEVKLGEGVRVGQLDIKTDGQMRMYSGFYPIRNDEKSAFHYYSFADVRGGGLPASVFKNKIVLIGVDATGQGKSYFTPTLPNMSDLELTANFIASILNQDFYVRPDWVKWAEAALFLVILLYLMFALPRLGGKLGALVSLLLLLSLIGAGYYLMVSEKTWLQSVSPGLLLVLGHMLITSKRFFLTERLKVEAETDSAQNNRMLGLSFQSQGQLDMSLDKFRKLPVDESVLELFYNLALDFERKRQFSKAGNCYDHILKHDAGFRDAAARKQRAVAAEQTVILGGKNVSGGGTLILDNGGQKPTLGRYEVEKELGKGAMGTVYLGRDPRINRIVAIKTLALTQEFEGGELQAVRERFFREAETAGRLSHPNIVTIFDAGEEHDLAYIAMEYLEGKDLTHYLQPGKPLPVEWVVGVIAKVADALDYAHTQGVVHRDIKPANIMYNEATRSVKVTDFGIARITASSRTKTGMVLGTPSYMSPEQLAGKHVDGRSDLFSLGVTLFEMLTGQQPFGGESLAALMYQIANNRHPEVSDLRPDLPACLSPILDKILHKDPDQRYQSGSQFRLALLECVPSATGAATS
jgi:serine/threonine-protein kinase